MANTQKYVYSFGPTGTDGDASMRALLGGKGANLAEMTNIGLPVPAGFTIGTNVCTYYYDHEHALSARAARSRSTRPWPRSKRRWGPSSARPRNPLLVSCRSGARDSMPGMMDTVLNIGLNDQTVEALAKQIGQRALRLGQLSPLRADVRRRRARHEAQDKNDHDPFEELLEAKKKKAGVHNDYELTAAQLKELVAEFKKAIKDGTGKDFPNDPMEQVWGAIGAVFGSWMNDRAIVYRRTYGIPHEWGTAVNVQAMVFGNLGDDCATGVAMTRDVALGQARAQRRLPDQRPGRRRGGRHPHAAADRRDAGQGHAASGYQRAGRDRQEARNALPRRAGHRVHDSARQGLDAANPQRQADRLCRRADRGRHGQRRADHARKTR